MHGCGAESDPIANAEVDPMGGVFEGGVGIGNKTTLRRSPIDEVQNKLRQEYDFLEEKRRELEFLAQGGDPLDFKFGNATSLSVQSTSLTDQHPDQFVTSEAKGSFAITASPHGDSVESSGRLGAPQLCEPNSADNLMLFDGENEFIEGVRSCRHPSRSNLTPSEQSSKLDRSRNAKELGFSTAFGVPRKAYKRRHRPRSNGDGTRSSTTDIILARGGHGTSLPSQHFTEDVKGLVSDGENPKDQKSSLNISLPSMPNGFMPVETPSSDNQLDSEIHGVKAAEATTYLMNEDLAHSIPEASASRGLLDNQHDQNSLTGVEEMSIQEGLEKPQSSLGKEGVGSAGQEGHLCTAAAELENQASISHLNGLSCGKSEQKSIPIDVQSSGAAVGTKGLDSESSRTRAIHSLDRNTNNETFTDPTNLDSNGDLKEQLSVPEGTPVIESNLKEQKEVKADDSCGFTNEICNSGPKSHQSDFIDTSQEEFAGSKSNLQSEVKDKITIQVETISPSSSETERKPSTNLSDSSNSQKGYVCIVGRQGSIESRIPEPSQHVSPHGVLNPSPEAQTPEINLKLATRGDEDSILKEAQIIEAKRKRIAELSAVAFPLENQRKSQWDYVVDEMVWLANDFAQERLWKMTAATQLCHEVAFTARLRFQEQNSSCKLKKVAHIMAKSVMGFWQSIEGENKQLELPISRKDHALAIREYAMRFLKYNDSDVRQSLAEAPVTPERVSDGGIVDVPREDHLGEENLFYAVSFGAMEAYRKSIESHVLHREKTGSSMHEEVETSAYDTIPDYAFEEDEGETSPYDTSVAIEGNKSSRFSQKKRKIHIKTYSGRPYGVRADVPFTQRAEYKLGTHQSMQPGKRPSNNLNASIPTKRMRTASRQRVLSPYSAATSGCAQLPIKTDASSGDTSSFQDDQSTLHGGSHMPNNLEVESVGDFEKHLPFDSAEVSKPKKKKKVKILGSAYEQRWQVDSNFQNEQRDSSRKRLEGHQLDSNGSNGLFGQHVAKKPKMMRQSIENSFENVGPVGGFVPSPAASQMSNMSNPNKLVRMLSGRDQGRRAKALKMSAGQAGSGSPWSLFEDQALVVLVHDLGPNWELVSDAFNSTLQFKCIYRKPKECKEQHKILMDRSSGDGADSADDSGSSQPYPSTLPGIPKGSARQLFQRLQGPMEEDTLRSHFEKMILIGQKYLLRKNQGYKHDPRQLQQPHDSHTHALSQICPNNLSGGPILTPLDLFDDAPLPSPDYLSVGCQGPRPSGLSISSQCALNSVLPVSGANLAVQGSSSMIGGNNFPSSSSPLNASVREARYVPRSASLPVDEHQRLQQYNQMRNMQSNMSAPGVLATTDRGGVHTLSSGNSTGMMGGVNRGIPMARPGFQGVASPSMLNSGSMVSPGMVALPNSVNMHSGVSSNQVNSVMRPRDGLGMMRPPQNQEAQRQMMVPEPQLQASQGSSQVVPPFGGLSSSFPNQSASPVNPYPLHHQQSHPMSSQQPLMLSPHHPHLQGSNHATNSQQQAYAIRLAKERHLQQRRLQQQQFSHSQPQLPISSSLQNSPKTTSQSSSLPVSVSPLTSPTSMTPMPQTHTLPAHGHARTAQTAGSSLTTQMSKQKLRQTGRQQLQPAGRHLPPQRLQSQSQQQAKLFKGVGRGNMMMHQNLQVDPSLMNELSSNQANQSAEKGEQATSLMQGHGLYSGSAHSPVQIGKQTMAPHSSSQLQQPQPKIYSGQPAPSTKHLQQEMPSNPGNSNQSPASLAASDTNSSQQSVPSSVLGSSNHQALVHQQSHVQPQPKLMNKKQATVQRVLQQNHVVNSDPSKKLQAGESQAEQRSMCKTSQIGVITSMPQECNNATNVADASTLNTNQWKGTEPLFDSIGAPPTNSAGSESAPQVNRGVSQRRSSGNLSPTGPDNSVNWLQKSSQLQPSSPVTQPQLQQQQQQLSPLQQTQVLQAGNSNSFARPNDCRLD
ncbi:chromatin modification-related protein EAF1 B-like isoform X1 [Solanum stenotomum]|uniref:chromatin modification-related protein EAF1 B-like isoform X1 n=1 Tax=Solanum stenotomum TaxID=172797 RepID=UPI0020D09798|nr:chromatin modification-related protein EAF1 B-like isoform X1 [Solanum stenotomum]XP_049408487.1 chromatin modification-related protein EAF1 B-like isoform X1 [Solanum stenotomum]